jgi:hypothetical protein
VRRGEGREGEGSESRGGGDYPPACFYKPTQVILSFYESVGFKFMYSSL